MLLSVIQNPIFGPKPTFLQRQRKETNKRTIFGFIWRLFGCNWLSKSSYNLTRSRPVWESQPQCLSCPLAHETSPPPGIDRASGGGNLVRGRAIFRGPFFKPLRNYGYHFHNF